MRKWKHLHKWNAARIRRNSVESSLGHLLLMTCTVTLATLPTLEWHAYWPESVTRAIVIISVETVLSPFSVIRLTPPRPELWERGWNKKKTFIKVKTNFQVGFSISHFHKYTTLKAWRNEMPKWRKKRSALAFEVSESKLFPFLQRNYWSRDNLTFPAAEAIFRG